MTFRDTTTARILTISGSLRRDSANSRLLRVARSVADPAVDLEPWGGLASVPPFDEDAEDDAPAAVRDMRAAFDQADALLISTPEYNGAIPGQLKNALDWASRPYGDSVLSGKLVAVTGASPSGYGAAWATEQLCAVASACGARVLDRTFCLPHAHEAFGDDGMLLDAARVDEVVALVLALNEAAAEEETAERAA